MKPLKWLREAITLEQASRIIKLRHLIISTSSSAASKIGAWQMKLVSFPAVRTSPIYGKLLQAIGAGEMKVWPVRLR